MRLVAEGSSLKELEGVWYDEVRLYLREATAEAPYRVIVLRGAETLPQVSILGWQAFREEISPLVGVAALGGVLCLGLLLAKGKVSRG